MNLRVTFVLSIVLLGLLCLMLSGSIRADTVNINSINANSSPFSVDISTTNLLAQYGITLANVTPGTTVAVLCGECGGDSIVPSSPPNTLTQFGNDNGMSYTLQFSTPLSTLSFSLAGNSKSGGSGTVVAAWSATAFDASGNVVSSVGDPSLFGTFSSFAPQPFTLTGPSIASVTFFTQCFNFCGTLLNIGDLSAPEIKKKTCQVSVSGISQFNANWGKDLYDHLGSDSKGPFTIARRGCALTSLTMALDFAGPLASSAYVRWDPGSLPPGGKSSLNSLLNLNGGYSSQGRVDWLTATRLAAEGTTLEYDDLGGTVDSDTDLAGAEQAVENEVCGADPHPVIVGVRSPTTGKYPGHFVLITGESVNPDGTKAFSINDPAGHSTVLGNTFYTNISRQPEFQTRGIVTDPPDLTGLSVSVDAIANILITDPNGQLAGFDPATGDRVQQIPHSAAAIDELDDDVTGDAGNPVQNVTVNSPASGPFQLLLTGTAAGEFTLSVSAVASDGTVQTSSFSGISNAGSAAAYQLQYSPTPGSPSTLTLIATFQSILADISNSSVLGLIDNQGIANALSSKINAASDAAARGDTKTEANVMSAFISQVNAQTGKHINGTAPQVLLDDANSLLKQIP